MSLTRDGTVKVNLRQNGGFQTRSVARLVAEVFCEKQDSNCDTPIHIDGDKQNNVWTNLVWRPRWFAWEYARQFSEEPKEKYMRPVVNIITGEYFPSVIHAGIKDGCLWSHVYRSAVETRAIYPNGGVYTFSV